MTLFSPKLAANMDLLLDTIIDQVALAEGSTPSPDDFIKHLKVVAEDDWGVVYWRDLPILRSRVTGYEMQIEGLAHEEEGLKF
jgi:hypothetical protein